MIFFPPKKRGRKNSANRYSKFPLMSCIRSKTIFHTKLVNRGLEVVIREELDADQWKRYEIFQDTLGGRPYLFNGGLPPGGSDGSGTPGIDYQVPAEALTDSEFAAIYKEAQKYVGTPYVLSLIHISKFRHPAGNAQHHAGAGG